MCNIRMLHPPYLRSGATPSQYPTAHYRIIGIWGDVILWGAFSALTSVHIICRRCTQIRLRHVTSYDITTHGRVMDWALSKLNWHYRDRQIVGWVWSYKSHRQRRHTCRPRLGWKFSWRPRWFASGRNICWTAACDNMWLTWLEISMLATSLKQWNALIPWGKRRACKWEWWRPYRGVASRHYCRVYLTWLRWRPQSRFFW